MKCKNVTVQQVPTKTKGQRRLRFIIHAALATVGRSWGRLLTSRKGSRERSVNVGVGVCAIVSERLRFSTSALKRTRGEQRFQDSPH